MSKPKVPAAPAPPDPNKVAAAQTGSNVTTGISNSILQNADTSGPYGSTTNSIVGYESVTDPSTGTVYQVPRFSQNTQLNAAQQGLLNQQNQLSGILNNVGISQAQRIGGLLGSPVDTSSLPAWGTAPSAPAGAGQGIQSSLGKTQGQIKYGFEPTKEMQFDVGPDDFSADRLRVEQALMERLNPYLQQDKDALNTQLINQGFVADSAAPNSGYNQAMDEHNRQTNDARLAVIGQAGQEQQRMFEMALQQGVFKNQAVAQDFSQNLQRAGFFNAAEAQEFAEILQRGTFANQAQAQKFGQMMQSSQFQLEAAKFQNQSRSQGLQETLALRNQPINEISALMSGGQVSLPNVTPYQSTPMQSTPIGDYTYQSANLQNQQWLAQQQAATQAQAGLYGALGSVAGAGLYGLGRR
jgi:hypothetical protein